MTARRIGVLWAGACILGILAWAAPPGAEPDAPRTDVTLVEMTEEGATLAFQPPVGSTGTLTVEICELEGKVLGRISQAHSGLPREVRVKAVLDPEKPADYFVRYRFDDAAPFRQRSIFFLTRALETIVLAQRDVLAGSQAVVQILVRDRSAGRPVPGATVRVTLSAEGEQLMTTETRTNARGEAPVTLDLPDRDIPHADLRIEVAAATAKDTVEEVLRIRSGPRTLLTTDKPMYQPGQTIHLRALSLARPSMKPLAATEAVFEVEDAKGNKVFKKRVTTDAFGISHADFVLADEVNEGTYTVRHIAGAAKEEKSVTVERYVLPKFKMLFTSDQNFYQPGDTVKGEVQVDYFFGKPVVGGDVHITCAKFDAVYTEFQTIKGKTDENGHYAFEVKLPDHFVGQPFEAGKASAKFDISVIDTADHREQLTRNLSVTANPIIVAAVPEGGSLIPGFENKVYLVTTYADGTPASCQVTWRNPPSGIPRAVQTGAAGFGQVRLTPGASESVTLQLEARDATGTRGSAEVTVETREQKTDDRVLLRTDRSLYRVGDDLQLSVLSSRKTGAVYVDLIKDGQTHLTRALELSDGRAESRLTLDAGLAGTVQVNAYVIGANGVVVRDSRLLIVDPANDLSIRVTADEESYLPGGEAQLSFRVTDARGVGTAAALGVVVVDEAVFALQDMQPGLEKVYFYLEKEIATPRYEIHGLELDDVVPVPLAEDTPLRREKAARVLLASAKGVGDYPVQVNTYDRDDKGSAFSTRMETILAKPYGKISGALNKYCEKNKATLKEQSGQTVTLEDLVNGGFLRRNAAEDPWGHAMRISGERCESCQSYHDFTLASAGIDGEWDTADDVSFSQAIIRTRRGGEGAQLARGFFGADVRMDGMVMAAPMAAAKLGAVREEAFTDAGGGAEPPRIREFFPETLFFNPAVITDGRGLAQLSVPIADSITTWRMSCMASSAQGALGSTTSGIRVFQDFFVDVDFPVALTQNDEVSVPVVVYNYLKTEQQVRLVAEKADWFEFKGDAEQTVTLGPSAVKAVYFPVVAKGIGFQKFTVFAYGAEKSDAVARSVEVRPDGAEQLVTHSGRLEGNMVHTIAIPDHAIPDASKVFVKVYPGMLSQVVEGLDSMLRMPSGCFEQTSSATYPNILVLDYMKTTGKVTPELQMKAEGFINAGYQRLVSFEVKGGGFEWFGNAPAHRILTAYGLMEFFDMSKVYEIDPAVITRTQRWLAGGQEKDGSFKPTEGGIAEGAINRYRDDVLRSTAYITWALVYSGYQGPEVQRGLAYIRAQLPEDPKDNFTLAMVANALVTADAKDPATLDVLQKLMDRRTEEDDVVYWKSDSETPTHGRGEAAHIEVTGLAVQAFVQAGREPGAVSKAVTWLSRRKDAYGTWQSTQATIQALRAMLMAERGATQVAEGRIRVSMHEDEVTTLSMDESNSDVLQLVDLKEKTRTGDNKVELQFEGEGSLLYQVVGRYYVPHDGREAPHMEEPMTITVAYDRTELATDDILKVTATATYKLPGRAKMVIVDLGLPPGFTLVPDELNKAVESGVIEKYTVTGRQVIVYLDELESEKPVTLSYGLLAKYPLRAKTAKSVVYEYYDPDSRAEAAPIELVVRQK